MTISFRCSCVVGSRSAPNTVKSSYRRRNKCGHCKKVPKCAKLSAQPLQLMHAKWEQKVFSDGCLLTLHLTIAPVLCNLFGCKDGYFETLNWTDLFTKQALTTGTSQKQHEWEPETSVQSRCEDMRSQQKLKTSRRMVISSVQSWHAPQ